MLSRAVASIITHILRTGVNVSTKRSNCLAPLPLLCKAATLPQITNQCRQFDHNARVAGQPRYVAILHFGDHGRRLPMTGSLQGLPSGR